LPISRSGGARQATNFLPRAIEGIESVDSNRSVARGWISSVDKPDPDEYDEICERLLTHGGK